MKVRNSMTLRILLVCMVLLFAWTSNCLAKERLTIHLVSLPPNAIKYINENVIPEFESKYNVEVSLVKVDWNTRNDELIISTAGGIPPDIYMSGAEHIKELVDLGLIYPIDKEWEAWEDKDDFFPATLGSSTFDGQRYGVPIYTAPRLWWYRKNVFDESGLDSSRPPTNWTELLNTVKRLTETDGADRVLRQGYDLWRMYPGDMHSAIQDYIVYLWQAGGKLVDETTRQPLFNTNAGREALQFMVDLKETVLPPGMTLAAVRGAGGAFVQSKSAIYLAGPWVPAEVRDVFPDQLDDVGGFYKLEGKGGAYSVVFSDWLGIHSASPNKELAWRFIQALTSAETLVGMHLYTGLLAPRRSVVEDFVQVMPASRYIYESMDYMRAFPIAADSMEMREAWFEQYTEVMAGRKDVDNGLAEAARVWSVLAK
ncbi:MAG: extracellular solute-binding protein [Limnochordia bacterium]|nr:extracellular solute-binding protein [Limnochordia bacterium]